MTMIKPPQADGLYDPRYEHDACGVAMVAKLDDVPGARRHRPRARGARQPRAPRRRGRRRPHRRRRRDPHPGPRRVLPRRLPVRAARAGPLRRRRLLPPARRGAAPQDRGADRAQRPRRGPARAGLARRADRRGARRRDGQPLAAVHPPDLRRGRRDRPVGRGPGRLRAQALRHPPHRRARRRARLLRPELLLEDLRLQGHAHLPAGRGLLPGPAGRALHELPGARALAVQHEHLPELGAGPPVPRDRPQRRDQHADGQRELDARPREPARERAVRPRPRRRSCRSSGPAARTPRRSTTSSSC